MTEQGAEAGPEPTTCPWCAAVAPAEAARCPACGAALAQRESIGDLRIPGLTSVDPALEDYDKRPLHLRGPSPSQGMAPALIVGAMAGGPIGLMAIGGVAAIAGAEFLGTRIGGPGGPALEDVGKPSEVAMQALRQLDGAAPGGAALGGAATGGAGPDGAVTAAEDAAEEPDAAAADGGMSVWRDLPPADPEARSEGSV